MGTGTVMVQDRSKLEAELLTIFEYGPKSVSNMISKYVTYDQVDDVFQEACLKAWTKLDQYRYTSTLKTWFYVIAINTAKDFVRRASVRGRFEIPMDASWVPSSEAPADRSVMWSEVALKISKLSKNHRDALDLYSKGHSLDLTHKLRAFRALRILRKWVAKEDAMQRLRTRLQAGSRSE